MTMHPFAFKGNKSGACGIKAGDRVIYTLDGRHGVLDEATHDGDAYVTFDGEEYAVVKWNHLIKEVK